MIIKARLSSGREIYGFATENDYAGAWDIGPTWNYLITGERLYLWDSGRRGTGSRLLEMLEYVGIKAQDLDSVILSHGHEDHDGGLFEFAQSVSINVMAHEIFNSLVKTYPLKAPSSRREQFPASCWNCFLPESFSQRNCLEYHRERGEVAVTGISGSEYQISYGLKIFHAPGHSPDAIVLLVDGECMLAGDTVLPDITPHPTLERFFDLTKSVLPSEYKAPQEVYGLRAYIRSLKKIKALDGGSDIFVLPGHRLFYDNRWQISNLETRVDDLIAHHMARCADILYILRDGPLTAEDIARRHFEARLLDGLGVFAAINEVLSHCEILESSGDAVINNKSVTAATGEGHFESLIERLK